MFNSADILAQISNNKEGLSELQKTKKFRPISNDKPIMASQITNLRNLATSLGIDFDKTEVTYGVKWVEKDGAGQLKIYEPRLVLHKGDCAIRWGAVYKTLTALQTETITATDPETEKSYQVPLAGVYGVIQTDKDKKNKSYFVRIEPSTGDVRELVFPLWLKKDVSLTQTQFNEAIRSGGWHKYLSPEYPTKISELVSKTPLVQLEVVKVQERMGSGDRAELVLTSADGTEYSTAAKSTARCSLLRYYGNEATESNPVTFTFKNEGQKLFGTKPYTDWSVTAFTKSQLQLSDLYDLPEDELSPTWSGVEQSEIPF